MTANFIDSKTQESFQNQTSSQVVETLASRHGMTADAMPTSTLVGRYYEMDHEWIGVNSFYRTTTEWNLMCSLAQKERYDIWVTGTTVHFHPTTAVDPNPYLVLWDETGPFSNAIEITAERAMSFAKDIVVSVRSWHSRNGKAYEAHSGES